MLQCSPAAGLHVSRCGGGGRGTAPRLLPRQVVPLKYFYSAQQIFSVPGRRHPELRITVAAILNDTTGCLVAAAYKRPDTAIGVIIGTGTNASYVEDIREAHGWCH